MKKKKIDLPTLLFVGAVLVGAVILGWQESSGIVPRGSEAPDFTLEKLDGSKVTLSALKGQVVVLNFWATWCGYCRAEMPYLTRVAQEYAEKGVVLVAVSTDDRAGQREVVTNFVNRMPEVRPFAALGTPNVGFDYSVRGLPANFIIGRDGKVFASQAGQISEARLRDWLDDALAAKD